MGIWLSALKAIPWGDVIAAAPTVTRSARKLFARKRPEADSPPADPPAGEPPLQLLQEGLVRLSEQQQAQAEVLEALAAQNARIVETLEILRMRLRLLVGLSAALGAGLLGMLSWLVWRG